jgi:NADH dehydrogenase
VAESRTASSRPRVLVVGAGFGGLRVARALRRAPVDVTVLDQRNYHLFVPLLYQVATAGLEPEEIAQPVRRILHGASNVRFRLAEVSGVDLDNRRVASDIGDLPYDFLVLAAGSATNYFGIDSLRESAAALRTLDDAEALRDRLLSAFERAAAESDGTRRRELMTIVIVGGGPTGVELAGAISELRRHVLPHDFPDLDVSQARILLVEATGRLLPGFPDRLQRKAGEQLERMEVELRMNSAVADAGTGGVTLRDGERIAAGTVIWVAGMRAPPVADALRAEKGASGRILVGETLQLPGYPEIFAIGDMAHVGSRDTRPHPMMAPVAIQQGDLVAKNIRRALDGLPPETFRYRNRGTMVTIGKSSAVAQVFRLQVTGFLAWVIWLTVHLYWLIGFRNRLLVLVNWAWNYFTYDRGVRLIRHRR